MIQALQWASLSLSAAAIAGIYLLGLCYALAARRRAELEAERRHMVQRFISRAIAREITPLAAKVSDHDLQLELLTAMEAERHARPRLSIAKTGDGPDMAA